MSNPNEESELFNTQDKASYVLGEVLEEEKNRALAEKQSEYIDVENAIEGESVLATDSSERTRSRLLLVTSDAKVLDESSSEHKFYLQLSEYFDEVHIIAAVSLRLHKKFSKRMARNLWVYTTGHVGLYQAPLAINKIAKEQLTFAEGFRPDLIVSTNPYEAGLGAYWIAKKNDRPFQVHVREAFWLEEFKEKEKSNKWRQRIANWLLKRVDSVHTTTNDNLNYLKTIYPDISDLDVLPRHYNIEGIVRSSKTGSESEMFSKFAFVMLFVGKLDHKSTLFRTIDAVREALKRPRTVLVVVGDGPAKEEFKERAKIFGVDQQVIFKPSSVELLPIMKSSDLFISTDINEASDDVVIKAAAAGSTLLLAKNELRDDLFTHGEDAYLCDPENTLAFTDAVTSLMKDNLLRGKMKEAAQYTVSARLEEDLNRYYSSYRDSLERAFNVYYNDPEASVTSEAEVKSIDQDQATQPTSDANVSSAKTPPPPVTQKV